MPDPLLTFLKYIFLAVLYLFFLRVLRAVWIELREPKAAPVGGPVAPPAAPPAATDRPGPPDPAAVPGRPTPPGGAAGPVLVVLRGDRQGRQFPLGDELTVGRAGGCGVALPDDTFVSQLHARVYRRDGRILLEDLGSTNGTYVNDRKVTGAVALGPGDQLTIGRTTLEVRA